MVNKLELLLRRAGRELCQHQVAMIWKCPEEMVQTPCDFFGYTASGRAILIEAKMVTRSALPLGCKPGLLPHQWQSLQEADRANTIALIVWANGGLSACLTIDMARELSAGRRSIPWSSIDPRYHRELRAVKSVHLLEPWLSITPRATLTSSSRSSRPSSGL